MDWFRCYTELPDDPKLERLPPIAGWLWVTMMCLANKSPCRGYLLMSEGVPYTLKEIAAKARLRIDKVRTFYDQFTNMKMVEVVDLGGQATIHLTNHDKRQYSSDSSTPRVRKHRAGNVTGTLPKRDSNVSETPPDTDTDTDTDTDQDQKPITSGDAPEPDPSLSLIEKELAGAREPEIILPILAELQKVKGYPMDPVTDIKYLIALARDFPSLDLLQQVKTWAVYKLDKPLERKSNPRSQFRRWCQIDFEKQKGGGNNGRGSTNNGTGSRNAPGSTEMAEWEERIYD